MSNGERKRSEFVYNLSNQQMEALLAIAQREDRPLLFVIMEAIDQYIQREKSSCRAEV
jgi:predicted transcriptional regulator